jgi:hypothetical protein
MDIHPISVSRYFRGFRVEINACHLPAVTRHSRKKFAATTADVQECSGRQFIYKHTLRALPFR